MIVDQIRRELADSENEYYSATEDVTRYLISVIDQQEIEVDMLKKLLLKASDGFRTIPYSREETIFIAKLRTDASLKSIKSNPSID